MNPISTAKRGKGLWNVVRRVSVIGQRYGLTSRKMERTLLRFSDILEQYQAKATFPITTAALARSNGFSENHRSERIEFAAHGYFHVDHAGLSAADQHQQLLAASQVFDQKGLLPTGFRCPYLRWNEDTLEAVKQAGFLYDSSQALYWEIEESFKTQSYRRVLEFYGAKPANEYPALPRLKDGLIHIPYCLPDDEALIDRLRFQDEIDLTGIWPAILNQTHRLGELFTLGLHPERLPQCEPALVRTMEQALELVPAVWFARLDEIANWWRICRGSRMIIHEEENGQYSIKVQGPAGMTVLARNVKTSAQTEDWDGRYRRVLGTNFKLESAVRPVIAVTPDTTPDLREFLHQQGYIVELAGSASSHALIVDRPIFSPEEERQLLFQIESADFPLVRFGRWPNGAKSALCITGDIDALTIWDYLLRFLGR